MKRLIFTFCSLLVLSSCQGAQTAYHRADDAAVAAERAKQQEMLVDDYRESLKRITRVADPIWRVSTDLCLRRAEQDGEADTTDIIKQAVIGHTGVYTIAINDERDETGQKAAAKRLMPGLARGEYVYYVTPNSPAHRAGIKAGDTLTHVDGRSLKETTKASPWASGAESLRNASVYQIASSLNDDRKVTLTLERHTGGAPLVRDYEVGGQGICNNPWMLRMEEEVNAFADGYAVIVTRGLLRHATTDDELALVLGHELAHNMMDHIDKSQQNAMVGGGVGILFDILAAAGGVNTNGEFSRLGANMAAMSYSVDFENEADYVGLYQTARAGYDITIAQNFWRKLAVASPGSITHSTSHPTTPQRFTSMEKTIAEIRAKQAKGQKLVPNFTDVKQ